ncbi:hypothetical protein H312_02852 [Anncaliia algerae PRA339]|uniref:ISXO2-like transposase domain-containing protein n=1 Tax=Anncaliia algerae PRA339 TaxID=1288291 RepID=A0A059EYE4_9MICR|nr:hypothetical protein H312_02852 [Anncaliia algerae PRA339]
MSVIIGIIVRYSTRQPFYSIKSSMSVSESTIEVALKALVSEFPSPDFANNKLGCPRKIVQIDETMLNFRCKSHLGRSLLNRTDSLCILKFEKK